MSEYDATNPGGNVPSGGSPDPLGVIGWVIAGKYKIISHLGGGGFGEVYEGHNVNLPEQRLVIKFFKRVQAREKFAKEAKILCMLDHPNISRVIDYLPDEGAVVVAFIDGKDGAKILQESGPLAPHLLIKVARALTEAIAYAHEKKIAHRDIKPGNILIDKNQHIYLIDFGIAKEIGSEGTKTGYSALTPMFAAPERQQGDKHYDPFISDIYEMGITLFNFATNDLPYRNPVNPNYAEWGGSAAAKLTPQLRRILMKATNPDPAKRYRSAADMAVEFQNIEEIRGRKGATPKKRFWLVPAVVVLAAAVLFLTRGQITGLLGGGTSSKSEPKPPISEPAKKPETTPAKPAPKETPVEKRPPETVSKPAVASQTPVKEPPKTVPATVPLSTPSTTPATTSATPPTQPPIQEIQFSVNVMPAGDMALLIDGSKRQPGKPAALKPGAHDLVLIHPDYPVYRSRINIMADQSAIDIDLNKEFASAPKINLQVALAPPTEAYLLELTMNSGKKTFTRFPVLDYRKIAGEWEIAAAIVPAAASASRTARVDSCVAYPYGGGPRSAIKGGRGIIKLEALPGGDVSSVPLVIYWKEK